MLFATSKEVQCGKRWAAYGDGLIPEALRQSLVANLHLVCSIRFVGLLCILLNASFRQLGSTNGLFREPHAKGRPKFYPAKSMMFPGGRVLDIIDPSLRAWRRPVQSSGVLGDPLCSFQWLPCDVIYRPRGASKTPWAHIVSDINGLARFSLVSFCAISVNSVTFIWSIIFCGDRAEILPLYAHLEAALTSMMPLFEEVWRAQEEDECSLLQKGEFQVGGLNQASIDYFSFSGHCQSTILPSPSRHGY